MEYDFVKCLINIFNSEDESKHIVTKIAILRMITVQLRYKHNSNSNISPMEPPTEAYFTNAQFINMLMMTL